MTTVARTFDDQDIAGQAMDAFRKEGFDGADLKILEGKVCSVVAARSPRQLIIGR
jgi:hypothetical protein